MMRFLHNLKLEWWQAAIYEAAMIAFGILIGTRFYHLFKNWVVFFLIIFLSGGIYIGRLWWMQSKSGSRG